MDLFPCHDTRRLTVFLVFVFYIVLYRPTYFTVMGADFGWIKHININGILEANTDNKFKYLSLYKICCGKRVVKKPSVKRNNTQHCRERSLRALMRFVITTVAFRYKGGFSLTKRSTAYRNLTYNISSKETAKNNETHNCRNKFRCQNRWNLKIQAHTQFCNKCVHVSDCFIRNERY
jgi:hypothetical protein